MIDLALDDLALVDLGLLLNDHTESLAEGLHQGFDLGHLKEEALTSDNQQESHVYRSQLQQEQPAPNYESS